MRGKEDKWSLPSDKGQGRINTFIIPLLFFTLKEKKSDGKISDNYKKGVKIELGSLLQQPQHLKGEWKKILTLYNHDIICNVESIIIRMNPLPIISINWHQTGRTLGRVNKIVNILYYW